MNEAEKRIREALAAGPTPGPWHHCQPFQSVRAERTLHGTVPAQRVDFVSTKTQPVHKRIIIPMAGEEAHVRSEDMAFIAACNPENIAALLAEIDRLTRERDEHARWRAELADKLHATESLVSELRAERDAMAKDAERYRWLLRNCSHEKDDGTVGIIFWCDFENYDDLDTAIDAQIEQERSEQKEAR